MGAAAKFPGKFFGHFLQNVTVSMNCWSFGFMGSLWRSLTIQWWGVGTLQDQLKRFGVDT
ncbi:hypothetical protein DBR45_44490 [Pseudomonas sp. HMWF031]|nr:hypothetical protein DBR45_44490 [Pseudomonas sp. HMWF031]